MGIKPFCLSETDRRRGQRRQARSIAADERAALEEVENAEARGEARAARRRQYMVGTGDIVADRLGRMAAEEDRTRVANPLGQRIGVIERQFEMLGRDPVDQRQCLFPVGDQDDRAVRRQLARAISARGKCAKCPRPLSRPRPRSRHRR